MIKSALVARLLRASLFCICLPALADDPGGKGRAIAVEADSRNQGYIDFTASLTMRLLSKQGSESIRRLEVIGTEGEGEGGDKMRATFVFPKNIKGSSFLTHSSIDGSDSQWLYMPALKRVKRISGHDRRSSFFGSEFSFEDLSTNQVNKYRYKYLDEEMCFDMQCHVITRYPLDSDSGYGKQILWMDTKELQVRRIEYFDQDGTLLKTLVLDGYKLYEDKFWRATSMHMVNQQDGRQTYLEWADFAFGTGLTDRDMDSRSLTRPLL